VAQRAGVNLVSLKLRADREPDSTTLHRLVEVLRTAPTPLLIHCESGADRTGLAAALYELVVLSRPAETAEKQLSFRYGHFPWLTSPTGAMDRAFWRVAATGS
jgi:protein tyrosine/serine phosphatase